MRGLVIGGRGKREAMGLHSVKAEKREKDDGRIMKCVGNRRALLLVSPSPFDC